ncbi:MAG: metal ABC transporter substrate-binding protein [Thermoleophilia bacterium]|nr:metal ABC transporter substrate-binding protein [Thermoleophilia bacterium]
MSRSRVFGLTCVGAALLAAAACGGGKDEAESGAGENVPLVVATTSIWSDVVSNVACDGLARVEALIPSGADPHAFEPSLSDRGTMESASLVVANGLQLEESLEDTLDAVEGNGQPVFRVAEHVVTISATADDEGADPHVWLDPSRVSAALPSLGDALVEHAGLDRVAVDACVSGYQDELAAVDAEVAESLSRVREGGRTLVSNHDALAYFADRYGLEVLGTVIPAPSTLAETNPAQLEELAEAAEQAGVRTIFSEAQHSDADVVALAERVGDIEVATLHTGSLGEPGSGAENYLGLLRTNAELIASGLS